MIGIIDDGKKLFEHKNDGIRAYQKILLQALISSLFLLAAEKTFGLSKLVRLPFFNAEIELGFWFYILFIIFFVFMSNSVNLTDGIDGLASSVTAAVCIFFAVKAIMKGEDAMATFAVSIFGGCLGFLVYNAHPARVFMGDTGSMFIGGAMVGIAMLLRQPLMLALICFTSIMSSVSVMMQVTYFKYTKRRYGQGRRIFKMSPIHHHFEKCGMTETQIDTMYAIVTGVLTLIAVLSVLPL